jgi:hypothetical protein
MFRHKKISAVAATLLLAASAHAFSLDGFKSEMTIQEARSIAAQRHLALKGMHKQTRSEENMERARNSDALNALDTRPAPAAPSHSSSSSAEANTLEYATRILGLPAYVTLYFNNPGHTLWKGEVKWDRIMLAQKEDEDEFIQRLRFTLNNKYGENIVKQWGTWLGTGTGTRRIWKIDDHSVVWIQPEPVSVKLIYEWRNNPLQDGSGKL